MKNMTSALAVCAVMVGIFLISGSSPAQEDSDKVLYVVKVDTHGNTAAYVAALKGQLARGKELAPESNTRVWEATVSGDTVRTVYVVTEFPNMAAFAAVRDKIRVDEAWAKGGAKLVATGRTLESNSLLREITP